MKSLTTIFAESLAIEETQVIETLSYQGIPQWDSVAHMTLIAAIEDEYGIMLDTDDIIDMSSFAKAKTILAKYDVTNV